MKATRINIRKRQISNGRSSLYLDYYPGVFDRIKKRMVRHETLYLYVYDRPETLADRQHNDEMMELARQIRTKRMIDISSAYYGITKKAALIKGDFLQYFEERCMLKNNTYHSVFKHFYQFCNGYCTFEQLSVTMCEQFRHYLLHAAQSKTTRKPLSKTTASSYYDMFLYILKIAYNDNAISSNLAECVSGIRAEGTIKTSLNYEELDRLFKTPCKYEVLRRASIFAVLSGLRRGDILALEWKDYEKDRGCLTSSSFRRSHGCVWTGGRRADFQGTYLKHDHNHFQEMGDRCRNQQARLVPHPPTHLCDPPAREWQQPVHHPEPDDPSASWNDRSIHLQFRCTGKESS